MLTARVKASVAVALAAVFTGYAQPEAADRGIRVSEAFGYDPVDSTIL